MWTCARARTVAARGGGRGASARRRSQRGGGWRMDLRVLEGDEGGAREQREQPLGADGARVRVGEVVEHRVREE